MKSLAELLNWKPESDDVRAALFVRLLHYFHKNPVSQKDIKIGEANTAILALLYSAEPVTFDQRHDLTIPNTPSNYNYTRYGMQYCLNCGTSGRTETALPFKKECVNCNPVTDLVLEVPLPQNGWHDTNPATTCFEYLPLVLRKNILKRLIDMGMHPCYDTTTI